MDSIQKSFLTIQEMKKKSRDIRTIIKDAFSQNADYQEVNEELKKLKEKKKTIEQKVHSEFERELQQLDDMKIDLETEMNEISDAILTRVMKGEVIKVRDARNTIYLPEIKVAFKKSEDQEI